MGAGPAAGTKATEGTEGTEGAWRRRIALIRASQTPDEAKDGLMQYGLDFLRKRGYQPTATPLFMNQSVMAKTAQLKTPSATPTAYAFQRGAVSPFRFGTATICCGLS